MTAPTPLREPTLAQRLRPLRPTIRRRWFGLAALVLLVGCVVVIVVLDHDDDAIFPIAFALLMIGTQAPLWILIIRPFRGHVPMIAQDRHSFVVRDRSIPVERVTRASAYRAETPEGATIGMTWGGPGVPRMYALLAWEGRPFLDGVQSEALAAALAATRAEPPSDPYDPGRRMPPFAGPGELDSAAAAALVRDPLGFAPLIPRGPTGGAPAPVPGPRWGTPSDPDPRATGPSGIAADDWLGLPTLRPTRPPIEIARSGEWLRQGRSTLHPGAVTSARVIRSGRRGNGEERIALRLGGPRSRRWTLLLFSAGSTVLDDPRREALIRFVERSSTRPPYDPYDPEGRMSGVANPGWLGAVDAARLIADR